MKSLTLAAAVALFGVGCVVHDHGPRGRAVVHGPSVRIEAGHVHSAHCGHYSHRGHWYHHGGHVHGPGCGHSFRAGVWIR